MAEVSFRPRNGALIVLGSIKVIFRVIYYLTKGFVRLWSIANEGEE